MENTPVLVLLFNRPNETKKLFEHLEMIKPRKLYINQDGPRKNSLRDLENCKKGQDCYILACGSSLNKYDNKERKIQSYMPIRFKYYWTIYILWRVQ